jgi:hypothetical protein
MHSLRRLVAGCSILLLFVGWNTIPAPAQSAAPSAQTGSQIVDAVRFREIGPTAQGGRYVEFAVVESNPRIFYAATATGGLWKTVNNGITFTAVFDNQPDYAIGAVALAQSRPDVVYVGTGEANNSRSSYGGHGVYKSVDAGKTWTKSGLANAGRIGRIVVDPKSPDVVFVAAPRTRTAASIAPPTAAPRGPRRSTTRSTGGRSAPSMSRWIR